jgi:long-chain acyl-CoA synthetase
LKAIDPLVSRELNLPEMPVYKYLTNSFKKFPDNIAIYYYGTELTYAELESLSNKLANGLSNAGIEKGDRVVIHMDNCPQYVIAFFALMKLGAVVVQIGPMSSAKELLTIVNDSRSKAIITLDFLVSKVQKILEESTLKFMVVGSLHDYLPLNPSPCAPFGVDEMQPITYMNNIIEFAKIINQSSRFDYTTINPREDLAVLQYTSGTTGLPKGIMVTHYNITSYVTGANQMDYKAMEGEEVWPVSLSLSHNYAMFQMALIPISLGGKIVIMVRFHPDETLKTIHSLRCTCYRAVPTILTVLAQHPDLKQYDLSSVRYWLVGGAPVPEEVVNVFKTVSGGNVVEGYGLTESTSGTIVNRFYGQTLVGMGMSFIGSDVRVNDPDTGEDVPIGESGELLIKGPTVSAGYWEKPEETSKTFRDGWLHTGDIVRMTSEGVLQFVDRLKEMIVVAGFNVYPTEVEDILYQHPKIMEVAIIGMPDQRQGEVVKAVIKKKPKFDLDADEVIKFCRERLSPYKVPKSIEFVEDFPRTASGKIMKRLLK